MIILGVIVLIGFIAEFWRRSKVEEERDKWRDECEFHKTEHMKWAREYAKLARHVENKSISSSGSDSATGALR